MTFIHDDFLLHTETARTLYHTYAEHQPILDYHNHLPPQDIATNRTFANLYDIWLGGDHYKWRAMRANGAHEKYCTGDADPYEKFLAWAETVPNTLRNPLYHWTHIELKRYFGIETLLNPTTAPAIWAEANAQLQTPALSTHGILSKFNVVALCTTDDPVDDLADHKAIAASGLKTKVYPAYRPDKSLNVHQSSLFNAWTDKLAAAADIHIASLSDFLKALEQRHDYFHAHGCRLSDHGLSHCYANFPDDETAAHIFAQARSGQDATQEEFEQFAAYMMLFFGRLDAAKGWTKQLHLGALRNASSRGYRVLGPDTGFDSIGDYKQAQALAGYLDRLDRDDMLPKTILYNNNPIDNYVFSTMVGNFGQGGVPGKMQFGSGWWYLDAKEGIEWQLNALSNNGLLTRFVGMLTDSRSFMSYPRHEYFRRVLCNLLGREMENGELPNDEALIGNMVADICYGNASRYLGLEI